MPYRLRQDEPVGRGVKRITVKELRSAVRALGDAESRKEQDEAVHEARKHVKKTRAALQLVRLQLGKRYSREDDRLREAGRQLSLERDADIIVEAFDRLRTKYRSRLRGSSFTAVRRALVAGARQAKDRAQAAGSSEHAARDLRKAKQVAKRWQLGGRSFAAMKPQLKNAFRQARKTLAKAAGHPTGQNFHDWRKRVKVHWYHMRLLEDTRPAAMREYVAALRRLETWLGEDHNQVVLRRRLGAMRGLRTKHRERAVLKDLTGRFQTDLRSRAVALGRRIYAEKPGAYARRVKRAWKRWRHHRTLPGHASYVTHAA